MDKRTAREIRRERIIAFLKEKKIKTKFFDPYGIHLRILDTWDFWPSTERYKNIKTKKWGRGLNKLLADISRLRPKPPREFKAEDYFL